MKRILKTLKEKWPEYLLEILVLIVGIYGAFAVENWNDERKERNAEKVIILNLRNEMSANKVELESIQRRHNQAIEAGIQLLGLFGKKLENTSELEIDTLLALTETYHTFEAKDGYIKSVIASGKLDYIQNDLLKSMITSFDGLVVDATQESYHIHKLHHERLWPLLEGKMSPIDRLKKLDLFPEIPPSSYQSDYEWFLSNKEAEDIIYNIVIWMIDAQGDEATLMKLLEEITETLDQELSKK